MATIKLGGIPVNTIGSLPEIGTKAPDFQLIQNDLTTVSLSDFLGTRLILNVFPSIDTSTCATSVRKFNENANNLVNTKVFCISRDLPFAQKRFCGTEGLDNVISLSDFNSGSFGKDYGVEIIDGKLNGLHSRAIFVIDEQGMITHTELVEEIANEPNYELALVTI